MGGFHKNIGQTQFADKTAICAPGAGLGAKSPYKIGACGGLGLFHFFKLNKGKSPGSKRLCFRWISLFEKGFLFLASPNTHKKNALVRAGVAREDVFSCSAPPSTKASSPTPQGSKRHRSNRPSRCPPILPNDLLSYTETTH